MLLPIRSHSLNFQKTLAHDDVDGAAGEELAVDARDDFAEGLDERADGDGSDCRGYITPDTISVERLDEMCCEGCVQGRRGVKVLKVSGEMTVTWYSPSLRVSSVLTA